MKTTKRNVPLIKKEPLLPELSSLEQYCDLMNNNDLAQLEIETDSIKIKLVKNNSLVYSPQENLLSQNIQRSEKEAIKKQATVPEEAIKSPMVGTIYLSPEPNSKKFIKIGDKVKEGQTLLIIEAMKVMNNISAPNEGTIIKIYVDDTQPVEYNQPLVLIQ